MNDIERIKNLILEMEVLTADLKRIVERRYGDSL